MRTVKLHVVERVFEALLLLLCILLLPNVPCGVEVTFFVFFVGEVI